MVDDATKLLKSDTDNQRKQTSVSRESSTGREEHLADEQNDSLIGQRRHSSRIRKNNEVAEARKLEMEVQEKAAQESAKKVRREKDKLLIGTPKRKKNTENQLMYQARDPRVLWDPSFLIKNKKSQKGVNPNGIVILFVNRGRNRETHYNMRKHTGQNKKKQDAERKQY